MPPVPATLSALIDMLDQVPADLPVHLTDGTRAIGPGMHITELRQADVRGMDCGGRTSHWQETIIEVLDLQSGGAMPVGKFRSILGLAMNNLGGDRGDLYVETSAVGQGIARYRFGAPQLSGTNVTLTLAPVTALCKPAAETQGSCAPGCCA